ncbi:DNA mismatch repair endonuclease MutL [Desulforudis sp. 1031]|uniref:DNA mismatch repair endonuclease MutL n=1 Tax=Desulforudis sp. 1031 TaxID=3416138 RepID=UPI003CFB6C68
MAKTGRITLLDEATINQIAAGEVVDRPASVVKELVENALDAGATKINVEIAGGGLEYIAVTDDGVGMDPEDARLAFERHATSKIRDASDLYSIQTLGFRGEALPSIAAVARVHLKTRARGAAAGTELGLEGGRVVFAGPAGVPEGTTVIVRDLYFNTPARLKFMRSPSSEGGSAADITGRLALARPDVAFTFRQNGRVLFQTPGNSRLLDAIATVFGPDVARRMLPVHAERDGVRVSGYAGPPNLARSSRRHQVLVINGRFVKSFLVAGAIESVYRGALSTGRHPVVVLHLEVDAGKVDVNVHPAKLEVRVAGQNELAAAVGLALQNAFDTALTGKDPEVAPPEAADEPDQRSFSQAGWVFGGQRRTLAEATALYAPSPILRPLGFLPPTYVVAAGPDGLYIVDQHAAHERILYEEFLERLRQNTPQMQSLAVPLVLELTPRELSLVEQYASRLSEYGFLIESFGGGTFVLRAVPAGVTASAELLKDILERLGEERPVGAEEICGALAACLACCQAVKAGEAMSLDEMQRLLDRLLRARNPSVCPHGRPTYIKMGPDELARRFLRE